jgi:DNA invertase Pin-like site-specific DNA recombinase
MERGQIARGSRLPQCKLNPQQVVEIRALDMPQAKIAQRFGIGQSQVGNIKRRKWWRHIP